MASSSEDALSFLDLLDLDEEVIDKRLKAIMVRNSHTNKSLSNALLLLQYKQLINHQEGADCDNDEECSFIAKLLGQLSAESIELACKITKIVLCLNHTSLTNKCEHLLQQILSDILDSDGLMSERSENDLFPVTLLKLYICDSILETANEKISLLFLEAPLESVLSCTDEKLKNHFLINTVPLLFEKTDGYNILDRIWLYLQKIPSNQKYEALKVLSILSELYLPIADEHGKLKIQSDIVLQSTFWEIILFGLDSDDKTYRKIANYLAKRAIDCVTAKKCDVKVVHNGNELFHWEARKERQFKSMWDDFFVLIESLEEKQSNIVLPSLQLFNSQKELTQVWLTCAFNLGLRHDNTQVKKKVIELKILNEIQSESEAKVLLEALNDSSLIDEEIENSLKTFESLRNQDETCLFYIMKAVPTVNWAPILLHNICEVIFSTARVPTKLKSRFEDLLNIVLDILKIPCNNAILRSRVQSRVMRFLLHIWIEVQAKEFFYVWSKLHVDNILYPELIGHIANWLQNANVIEDKDDTFFNSLTNTYTDVSVIRAYLEKLNRAPDFVNKLTKKLKAIQEVISRQYCKKTDCLHEFVYLSLFCKQINELTEDAQIASPMEIKSVKDMIQEKHGTMIQYILDLVLSDSNLSIEDMDQCITCCKAWLNTHEKDLPELRNLESVCIKILKENDIDLQRKLFAISIVIMLMSNNAKVDNNFEVKDIVNFAKYSAENVCDGNQNIRGRLQNRIYEKSCEMLWCVLKKKLVDIEIYLNEILAFIDNATECGGYGCLKYIIKIMTCLIPTVHSNEKYNLQQFIQRMWKETEELKSNSQYATCIEEFVKLITNDVIISSEKYNNVVLFYCEKIIEYGSFSNKPLLFLIKRIRNMNITSQCGQIVFVLHQILLFASIPRKDQRVLESTLQMLYPKDDKLYSNKNFVDIIESNFSSIIHHEAVNCLLHIFNYEVLKSIITLNSMRIDDMFKNKKRYHGSCHHHKVLLLALQHQLMIALLEPRTLELANVKWSVALMSKLPHQTSVRVCLEWYIALYLRFQNTNITEDSLYQISFKTIPQLSQFQILYSVLKHKMITKNHNMDEYNFVMDYLLSHTMGQTFNIRLHAQYLAYELYKLAADETKTYDYTMKLIERNFGESSSEKNYIKLKEDFFANAFDIVGCLTPDFVYSLLVVFAREKCYQGPEPLNRLPRIREFVEYLEKGCSNSVLIDCWRKQLCYESTESKTYNDWRNRQTACAQDDDNAETSGNIQKKYIPWRSMSDFDGFDANKKKKNPSELIVVASLIDKLPNLGGMARTSEVFGVGSYVVDSIRHLHDKQFQGLSVSAERWVDIQEVRPGNPLKQYLMMKKHQGYSIAAAEQTSGSVPLHTFRFPKKTVLLLGHEKEGVPCDLLPLMDFCVEIQQQGYVRSLNVHVTAAIFIWEYSRQNILLK